MGKTQWFEGDLLTNGIRIHYYRTGGAKPQVVLCHGYSDNAMCWKPLARELQADYDVIMVDARCHGKSEAPRDGNSTSAMADDLAGLIRALGLDRPVLAGHSMGAGYVFEAAARYPELMRGIVLEDPVWRDMPPAPPTAEEQSARNAHWRVEFDRRRAMPREEQLRECREQFPLWDEEIAALWTDAKADLSPSIFASGMLSFAPWREVLAQVRCPILVFTADPDKGAIVTEEAAQEA